MNNFHVKKKESLKRKINKRFFKKFKQYSALYNEYPACMGENSLNIALTITKEKISLK